MNNLFKKNNVSGKDHRSGFSLVELLVAIGLFSVLVAIAAGGFTTALRTQREVAALIAAQTNASVALEQIAREVRTGYLFCHDTNGAPTCTCTNYGGLGSTWICSDLDYYTAASTNVHYFLQDGALMKSDNSQNGGEAEPIIGDNVNIKYLSFNIYGSIEDDHWTPRITISMGVAPSSSDVTLTNDVLNLQTTISAREIDCNDSGC